MRKVLVSLAAVSAALVVAAPASAQPGYGYGYGHNRPGYGYPGDRALVQRLHSQIAQIENRIERSAQRRLISGGEYRALRNQAANLHQRLNRFAYNGLSRGEVQDIVDRIDNLRDRLRDERRDGRRYDDRPYRGW
jgi:hypothetical protein